MSCWKYVTFAEAIEKAKNKVKTKYDGSTHGVERDWLEANIDSYDQESERLRLLVLEGSPCKGFIIVNYGMHTLTAFDVHGNKIYTLRNLRRRTT